MMTFRSKLLLFVLALILVVGMTKLSAFSSNGTRWGNVTFATHSNALKFFDQTTGKVYVYSESDGRLLTIWQVTALGNNLTQLYDWQKKR